jgi:hypothetical protein
MLFFKQWGTRDLSGKYMHHRTNHLFFGSFGDQSFLKMDSTAFFQQKFGRKTAVLVEPSDQNYCRDGQNP